MLYNSFTVRVIIWVRACCFKLLFVFYTAKQIRVQSLSTRRTMAQGLLFTMSGGRLLLAEAFSRAHAGRTAQHLERGSGISRPLTKESNLENGQRFGTLEGEIG